MNVGTDMGARESEHALGGSGLPGVSVVMPACNAQDTIGAAIDSLLAQDYASFELIVVDDGSTDATADMVALYAQRDDRVRLMRQTHASAGAARNAGLALAQGDYLIFVDADDVFEPALLSTLYAAACVTDADMCICNADCFTDDPAQPVRVWGAGAAELEEGFFTAGQLRRRLYQCTTTVVWNKLIRAELVREHGLQFQDQPRFNDAYFAIMALAHARSVCKLREVLVHYRVAAGGSLVDREAEEPYCDLQAFEAARTALADAGLLQGSLLRSFDTLCVNTIIWRLAHFARGNERATHALYDAYFGIYEQRWKLADKTWPFLRDPRYALERALMRRVGAEGLMRAAAPDGRTRTSGRDVRAEAAFVLRLAKQAVSVRRQERT